MKLIEALKNLKTIEKRIHKNAEQIGQYAAYVSVEQPAFETEERQRQEVASLIQANADLEKEYLRLKVAIEVTNLRTTVTINGKTNSISELIAIRRGVGKFRERTYQALNASSALQRMQQSYNKGIDAQNPPRVVALYREEDKIKALREWEEFTSAIDGKLEVVNAETDLIELF